MSFCSFSKEFNENACTEVENRFISKYLPVADGFAVKVYLYGLYLCKKQEDFSVTSMAEVLKTTEEKILDAFLFWEDYDLVEVLSKDPLAVNYLSARSTSGKPKKVRYDQYGDFNKELQRKMQVAGKFLTYNDSVKFMQFLEENEIQPQALLLIAEYCINKQGESVSPSYVFNKAKKFMRGGYTTYEQVEKELSGYNANEKDVTALLSALSLFRKPDETDYAYYMRWTEDFGFEKSAIFAAAKYLKRGSMDALNGVLEEISQKGKTQKAEVEEHLSLKDTLSALTFKIGRKLALKISNPAPYIEEYVEKWYNYGFEESSLCDLALYCLKTDAGDFATLDSYVETLFKNGVISTESVSEYLKTKNDDLRLFLRIQTHCGNLRKSAANLALIETWRGWNFSDEMILEAAKRSSGSQTPVPYMNKILADWKHTGVFKKADIPEHAPSSFTPSYAQNPYTKALDDKTERERYYFKLRDAAEKLAEQNERKAEKITGYKETKQQLSRMEFTLAKAEITSPEKLPELQRQKAELLLKRRELLSQAGLTEEMIAPQYHCKKCSDTGFLSGGAACDCYDPQKQANT